MKLYNINQEIEDLETKLDHWAADNEGDISAFPLSDKLDELAEAKDEKILNLGTWIKNLLADEKMIAEEIKSLNARRAALKNKAESVKLYVAMNVEEGQKLSNGRCAISWRKSEQVNISCDIENLPDEYQKIEIKPDKAGLKRALKNGQEIPAVSLETKQNVQIR